jgi:thiamine biosynthesis protein ThiS
MSILVNGKIIQFVEQETVSDLLKRMHYTFPLIIVKINDKIIRKKQYNDTIIPDDSDIKVIHMISGG